MIFLYNKRYRNQKGSLKRDSPGALAILGIRDKTNANTTAKTQHRRLKKDEQHGSH
jgi:hypothetical protein